MADSQADKVRREKIETEECFSGIRHTGTRERLIAAGLAKPEQFPGEPGCGKTSTVFKVDGRKVRVVRRSTYLFEVIVGWTPEERVDFEARCAADFAGQRARSEEIQQRRSASVNAQFMREALAQAGPRGLAETALKGGILSVSRAFNMSGDPAVPYSFDATTIERATEHCRALMAMFDSATLWPKLSALAQSDAEFQRFMTVAAGTSKKS